MYEHFCSFSRIFQEFCVFDLDDSSYFLFFYYLFMSTRWRSISLTLNFIYTSQTKCQRKEINVILVESLNNKINELFHLIGGKDQRKSREHVSRKILGNDYNAKRFITVLEYIDISCNHLVLKCDVGRQF